MPRFSEINSERASALPLEAVEARHQRLELDEHIFDNLHKLAAVIPEEKKEWYGRLLDVIDDYKFRHTDMLVTKLLDDHMTKAAKKGHAALPNHTLRLVKQLRDIGVEVPWYDSAQDTLKTPSQEDILNLVAIHDALSESLKFATKVQQPMPTTADLYRKNLMMSLVKKYNKLPEPDRSQFERLVTDQGYYHSVISNLQYHVSSNIVGRERRESQAG